MKSTTWPSVRRSQQVAEPRRPAPARARRRGGGCARCRRSIATITAETAIVTPTKNQRCQPPAPARKLKAAPGLCTRTRLRNGVTTRTSPARKIDAHPRLGGEVGARPRRRQRQPPRSSARGRPQACLRSSPGPSRFDTQRAADRRVARVGADVLAVVPAALALGVRAGRSRARRARSPGSTVARRGDEDEAQVVAQALQERAVALAGRERHLGLQRRADAAALAQLLEAASGRAARISRRRAHFAMSASSPACGGSTPSQVWKKTLSSRPGLQRPPRPPRP